MENNPKVFISYAHKNQAYEDKVLELANRLRSEGIDAMIDQYEEAPPEGWPRWMEHQIMESEFVLVLCEETYYQKLYSEKKGKGVVWEANIKTSSPSIESFLFSGEGSAAFETKLGFT